jgi:anaerobilin synthase
MIESYYHTLIRVAEAPMGGLPPWNLFPIRVRSAQQAHRAIPFERISAEDGRVCFAGLMEQPTTTPLRTLYVHVPFCDHACHFCFYACFEECRPSQVDQYFSLLQQMVIKASDGSWSQAYPFEAVYFGGGTPTFVPAAHLTSLLHCIRRHLPLKDDCEVTVESTLTALTPQYLTALMEAGVNRVSLGVQSFDTEVRRKNGRLLDKEGVVKVIEEVAVAGITNIAIDLIYTLKGHTDQALTDDLETIRQLPVTGCSLYPLIRRESPGGSEGEDLEMEYRRFMTADGFLCRNPGWVRFTPVQYGHALHGRAVYVQSHGLQGDILALGPSTVGQIHPLVYVNSRDPLQWLQEMEEPGSPQLQFLRWNPQLSPRRKIFRLSEARGLATVEMLPLQGQFGTALELLNQLGLIQSSDNQYTLTPLGGFWAGNISAVFAEILAGAADNP